LVAHARESAPSPAPERVFSCVCGPGAARQVAQAVSKIIAEVGLTEKINVQSKALSGGMKRKLSVAIALIGDSKVVFLGGWRRSALPPPSPLLVREP
jgi:ABC-type branched-subunit amino acid transport system ATPase component